MSARDAGGRRPRPRPFRLGVDDPLLVLPGDDDITRRGNDGDDVTDDTADGEVMDEEMDDMEGVVDMDGVQDEQH